LVTKERPLDTALVDTQTEFFVDHRGQFLVAEQRLFATGLFEKLHHGRSELVGATRAALLG
jgi:hypothetical protein